MKILVIVPAFNEGGNIRPVIADLRKNGFKDILVIDDGSTDATYRLARAKKVAVVSHLINRGLGAAIGTGWEVAKQKKADILITFDSDRQHRASDLKRLTKPLLARQADVVIGSRWLQKQTMPLHRKIYVFLSNLVTYLFYGVWSSDSTSGLRAFNSRAIGLMNLRTDRMEISNEFFREIYKHRLRYKEIPIEAIYTSDTLEKSGNRPFWSPIQIGYHLVLDIFRS